MTKDVRTDEVKSNGQAAGFATWASEEMLEQKKRDFLRMRMFATLLLAGMVLVFIAARLLESQFGWVAYIGAFAEAAMIGALADWFAVTALFRYPLGIPIPHTAVVQNQKDRIGESLGNFVQKNFLTEEAISRKLGDLDVATSLGRWLDNEENSSVISRQVINHAPQFLLQIDDAKVENFVDKQLKTGLQNIEASPLAARLLGALTDSNKHQDLLTESIKIASRFLAENRHALRDRIKKESPWFVPGAVDNKVVGTIISKIEQLLLEIEHNPDHEMRDAFTRSVETFVQRLETSPDMRERGEMIKRDLLDSPATRRVVNNLWRDVKDKLLLDLANEESRVGAHIESAVQKVGQRILNDEQLQRDINQQVRSSAIKLILERRREISELIVETIRTWDGKTMAERVELHVGRDLQFIRINGTIVGGLVGLLIYTLSELFF